jgi:hypothetical protein
LIKDHALKHKGVAQAFDTLITDTLERQGWNIPEKLKQHMVEVLVNKLDQNPWQPQPSYAEQYMTVRTVSAIMALGDTCWFTRAVFPDIGAKRGISSSYYTDLGQGCYTRVLAQIGPHTYLEQLRDHFDFLAEVAWTVVHSQGDFREMWS